jgi:ankyrin repeat protein
VQDNQTPLHYAAQEGHLPCVQLLVKKGATVDAKNKVKLTAVLLASHMANCLQIVLTVIGSLKLLLN